MALPNNPMNSSNSPERQLLEELKTQSEKAEVQNANIKRLTEIIISQNKGLTTLVRNISNTQRSSAKREDKNSNDLKRQFEKFFTMQSTAKEDPKKKSEETKSSNPAKRGGLLGSMLGGKTKEKDDKGFFSGLFNKLMGGKSNDSVLNELMILRSLTEKQNEDISFIKSKYEDRAQQKNREALAAAIAKAMNDSGGGGGGSGILGKVLGGAGLIFGGLFLALKTFGSLIKTLALDVLPKLIKAMIPMLLDAIKYLGRGLINLGRTVPVLLGRLGASGAALAAIPLAAGLAQFFGVAEAEEKVEKRAEAGDIPGAERAAGTSLRIQQGLGGEFSDPTVIEEEAKAEALRRTKAAAEKGSVPAAEALANEGKPSTDPKVTKSLRFNEFMQQKGYVFSPLKSVWIKSDNGKVAPAFLLKQAEEYAKVNEPSQSQKKQQRTFEQKKEAQVVEAGKTINQMSPDDPRSRAIFEKWQARQNNVPNIEQQTDSKLEADIEKEGNSFVEMLKKAGFALGELTEDIKDFFDEGGGLNEAAKGIIDFLDTMGEITIDNQTINLAPGLGSSVAKTLKESYEITKDLTSPLMGGVSNMINNTTNNVVEGNSGGGTSYIPVNPKNEGDSISDYVRNASKIF